jgi:DDE superfamily endonuclease
MWCIAEMTPEYVRKMEDVLEIYERPYEPSEPVVCLDEKPVTLHADVRPPQPAAPGEIAKRDNEYQRCGTANVFCVVEPKAGQHFTWPTPDRSADQFAQVLFKLATHYPAATTIHLVMDNLNTHCRKSLANVYGEEFGDQIWGRFTVHHTPTHGSWLNQAEIEISLFARQCLGTRRIPTLVELKREAKAWNRRMNERKVTINWRFTRKVARAKFGYKKKIVTRSKT